MSNPETSDVGVNDVSIVDLVDQQFFAIVSFPTSDLLQQEYNIFFGEDMFKCINFKEGNAVKVKYGDDIRQGTIVKIASNELYLRDNFDEFIKTHEELVKQRNMKIPIGPNGMTITKEIYDSIDWSKHTSATKGLLMAFFSKEILATHSLSGRPLSTRINLSSVSGEMTGRLDPTIVCDIVEFITRRFNVSDREVRLAIASKCASEKVTWVRRKLDEMFYM